MTLITILTTLENLAEQSPALFFLLDVSIKACLILILAFLLQLIFIRRSAFVKSILWSVTLVPLLFLPLLHEIVPGLVFKLTYESSVVNVDAAEATLSNLNNGILLLYLFISLAFLFNLWSGIYRVVRFSSSAMAVTNGNIKKQLDALRDSNGVNCHIDLLISDKFDSPLTWGIHRHKIILPSVAENWEPALLAQVISHELAHIQRHDWLMKIITSIAKSLFWINPLIWVAQHKFLLECEKACDEMAVGDTGCSVSYAENLLKLASSLPSRRIAHVTNNILGSSSVLGVRIRHILSCKEITDDLDQCGSIPGIILAVLIMVPFSSTDIALKPLPVVSTGSGIYQVSYFPKESEEFAEIMSQLNYR